MTNTQDPIAQAVPGDSAKDGAPSKISSTEKDALADRTLDDVAGGTTGGAGGVPLPPRGVGGPGG